MKLLLLRPYRRANSTMLSGDKPVMALVRGDHSLHESKLARYLKSEVRAAHPEEVKEATGAEVGMATAVRGQRGKVSQGAFAGEDSGRMRLSTSSL